MSIFEKIIVTLLLSPFWGGLLWLAIFGEEHQRQQDCEQATRWIEYYNQCIASADCMLTSEELRKREWRVKQKFLTCTIEE